MELKDLTNLTNGIIEELKEEDLIPQLYPKMIPIKGGAFVIGSTQDQSTQPTTKIKIKDFLLAETETTNQQYCVFLNAKGNQREGGVSWYRIHDYSMIEEVKGEFVVKKGYENHPVVGVSWFGAIAYCDWLSEKTGETYRLPSESEWEYAAGGGASNRTRFSGTDQVEQLDYFGNKKEKSRLDTFAQVAPVASFQKNAVGLHDMSGNVWEWCFDVWHTDYRGIPKSGDPWIEGVSADRVMRGGSWSTEILQLWISFRDSNEAHQRYDDLGFRVAKDK